MKNLQDFILIVKNAISIDDCKYIIYEHEKLNLWEKAKIQNNVIDEDIRNTLKVNINIESKSDQIIFNAVKFCIKDYCNNFKNLILSKDLGYELLKYTEGGFYTEHVDSCINTPRTLSCSIILNDDYEGGNFEFFESEYKIKLSAGDAILFPSNFMFPHQITKITKGQRYAIITWIV